MVQSGPNRVSSIHREGHRRATGTTVLIFRQCCPQAWVCMHVCVVCVCSSFCQCQWCWCWTSCGGYIFDESCGFKPWSVLVHTNNGQQQAEEVWNVFQALISAHILNDKSTLIITAVKAPINWLCLQCETIATTHLLVWAWERRRKLREAIERWSEKRGESDRGTTWQWMKRERDWPWRRRDRGVRDRRPMYFYKLKTAFACQRSPEELIMRPAAAHCINMLFHILIRKITSKKREEY